MDTLETLGAIVIVIVVNIFLWRILNGILSFLRDIFQFGLAQVLIMIIDLLLRAFFYCNCTRY